jgi:hypothetical protein
MRPLTWLFSKVTYSCTACNAEQKIPLRRVHAFERFYDLTHGQPVLIQCPACHEGLQCPSSYRSHRGHLIVIDPGNPPENAFIHALY